MCVWAELLLPIGQLLRAAAAAAEATDLII
jgi:hypothetical protein